ncbi:hypothetical protein [Stackebrandtia nassauensis]|uniref:Integrin alpha beta-propellor repeat protein n=1 Tax=Stackebrandtia nassauensis (strain DSM 44728 / CIP 108903 / NRRL B-16338 / NBRC 102104 / LLR-40K-21) TaxID=446470 RepID=D3Q910_STANL|nr:hypothetical protein [Stackebrandtia nassauensis]ADD40619.1 hypothetical protein Snas_0908 [Stackebrandtia nassauensis DSM 44728]
MRRETIRLWSGVAAAAVVAASALAITAYAQAGDFNRELTFDLDCDDKRDAVEGVPYATVEGHEAAGAVKVKYSKTGEKATISQATPGVPGSPEPEDDFGTAVTSYDENGDGCDDLVVSSHQEDVIGKDGKNHQNAGMIWVIPGSPSGLDTQAARGIHYETPGIPGSLGVNQYFGERLLASNSTDGPYLLIVAPGLDDANGAVYFLRAAKAYKITQDSPGVSGAAEPEDNFGATLAVNDRYFAIGSPGEEIDGADGAGMAHVFSLQAVNGTMKQLGAVHQNTSGISGVAEKNDGFGGGLSVVPYQPSSGAKAIPLLSVGAPGEDIGGVQAGQDAGMAHLITFPSTGTYKQVVAAHENTPGVPGEAEGGDNFGYSSVLVPTEPSGVATPLTAHWVVAGGIYDGDGENHYTALYVLRVSESPGGGNAKVIDGDDYGLWFDEANAGCSLQADTKFLYCGYPPAAGVPWGNILHGESEPTEFYRVDD